MNRFSDRTLTIENGELVTDFGTRAVEEIFKALLIDEEWAERSERSFSWIGHRLLQTVSAGKLFEDDGIALSRLTASTVVVKGVQASEAEVLNQLARLNRHSIGSAYSFHPDKKEIRSTAIAYVHEETAQWRPQQLGIFTILQLCIAESEADFISHKCSGSVAVMPHPENGYRGARDDMLNVLDAKFAREGFAGSEFRDKFEFEAIADMTKNTEKLASLGGSETGLAIEVPFGDSTSLAYFSTDEPHRRAGYGLTGRLHLPLNVNADDAGRIAAVLNRAEQAGYANSTHYGAWCWDEWPNVGKSLTYRLFLPNAVHRQGISQDAALFMAKRAIWVDGYLNSELADGSAWHRLSERFGFKSSAE